MGNAGLKVCPFGLQPGQRFLVFDEYRQHRGHAVFGLCLLRTQYAVVEADRVVLLAEPPVM
ncbi:hypothetical protein [Streptomyces sp. 2A115]|uniref:hypothetical protein n=1 Tax=Streptomyces sp. 2A115 TaxID=3457439 RepID=UPI003FD410E3